MIKSQSSGGIRRNLRALPALLTAAALALGCVAPAYASETSAGTSGVNGYVTVGDFEVTARQGTVTITGYDGDGGEITLPQNVEIQGETLTVTGMNSNTSVFKNNKKITKVTIPEGYTSVSGEAFKGCTALTEINIPGSVNMIGYSAFEGCSSLSSVSFDEQTTADSLSVGANAFDSCGLTSLTLPSRLSSLNGSAFIGNSGLSGLNVEEGAAGFAAVDSVLYYIEGETAELTAYAPGKTDTEFTVPSSVADKAVTSIGLSAFRKNGRLQKLTLPASVTRLNSYAFDSMSAISELVLKTTTAPELSSNACTNFPEGSKIIVENEEVAEAFATDNPTSLWPTYYYTEANTALQIGSGSPTAPETVSAALSIAAQSGLSDGKAVYDIYLDRAENVTTVMLRLEFDALQVGEGDLVSAFDEFNLSHKVWEQKEGKLLLTAYLGKSGDEPGYTSEDRVKLATVSVPVNEGAAGRIAANLSKAGCAGIVSTEESAMTGTAAITAPSSAEVIIENLDVNGDGTVDIADIAQAQRYYKSSSGDKNWDEIRSCDVDGNDKINIEDFIAIFRGIDF